MDDNTIENTDVILNEGRDLVNMVDVYLDPSTLNIDYNIFKPKNKLKVPVEELNCSIEQKIKSVIIFQATGNLSLASREAGVPRGYIAYWRMNSPWWPIVYNEIERQRNLILDAKLTEIIHKSTDEILDRISNGDTIVNQYTGDVIRVPVKMKDLGDIGLAKALEKRIEIRSEVDSQKTSKTIEDHLKQISDKFLEIAKAKEFKKKKDEAIEGELVS